MIIDPRGLGVVDWTSQVTLLIDKFGPVGTLLDKNDWQRWAANVVNLLGVGLEADLPSPYQFDDWLPWAERFCQVTDSIL